MLWHILIHCTAKTFHGNRDIFFVNCGHFKADDAIHTIMNTKLGSLALESEQNTLSEKEKIKIVDDAMYFDIRLMNGQWLSEETADMWHIFSLIWKV